MTNETWLRFLSAGEMAAFLEKVSISGCPKPERTCLADCAKCWLAWLQAEHEEPEENGEPEKNEGTEEGETCCI